MPQLDKPEDHTADTASVMRDGRIFRTEEKRGATTPIVFGPEVRDSAVRATWTWAGDGNHGTLGLRSGRLGKYQVLRNATEVRLERYDAIARKTHPLAVHPVAEREVGKQYGLELRAVGRVLTVKLNNEEILRVEDDQLTSGRPVLVPGDVGGISRVGLLELD